MRKIANLVGTLPQGAILWPALFSLVKFNVVQISDETYCKDDLAINFLVIILPCSQTQMAHALQKARAAAAVGGGGTRRDEHVHVARRKL